MKTPFNRSKSLEVTSCKSTDFSKISIELFQEGGQNDYCTGADSCDVGYSSELSLKSSDVVRGKPSIQNLKNPDSGAKSRINLGQASCWVDDGKKADLSSAGHSTHVLDNSKPKIVGASFTGAKFENIMHDNSKSTSVSHKPLKTGRQLLRWNLLFNLLVWTMVALPIWLPFVSRRVSVLLLPAVQSLFVFMWLVICLLASRNMIRLFRKRNYDFRQDYVEASDVHHLFIVSAYKEPVELLIQTVGSIAKQQDVHNITMTFSFEEKTPELEDKIQKLTDKFQNSGFARLLFTAHPYGLENEIPGKCSNSNYGLRKSVEMLKADLGPAFDPERIVVTTCDADSQFPTTYASALTSRFLQTENKNNTIFQAPLFYNWGLDGASFITRVTGLVRSTLMLGALIPFNINSMSIFSFSLSLCIDGHFVHPGYQMDDIICLIRWMGVTGRRIRICFIPVAVISGPTCGSTVELDIIEWARQARRWTIGAAEVFHYFMVKSSRMPALPALSWGLSFVIYYGILLCSGSLYGLTMSLSMYFLVPSDDIPVYVTYWLYALAGTQQLCFLIVFILDVFATRVLHVKEYISFVRNVFQWIMSPLVLLAYSLVEFYALMEVAVRGKQVCKHGASKKEALK